ncbi:MAG: triose-phosphate isomerase [Planctomycetes bacterium]|nr:triose-phosphate isomerase [Planctomycetota bacterium]
MPNRTPIVFGNWKMTQDRAGAVALAAGVHQATVGMAGVQVGVCPAFVHLDAVGAALKAVDSHVALGAQDAWTEPNGAFTGEVSLAMLKDLGVSWVLCGHSERRHVIGESDELVSKKALAVLNAGMNCILCCGETLAQREAGETDRVNERQVRAGLNGVTSEQMSRVVIAYEPVWAIGTGKNATPQDAQNAHVAIRGLIGQLYGAGVAAALRIQYGGSMKPENARDLINQPDVDGGLIGGAALKSDSFAGIVRAAVGSA